MNNRLLIVLPLVLALVIQACQTTKNQEPNGDNFTKTTATIEDIDSLVAAMTLEEKIAMIHASSSFTSGGVPRLGIPELVMSDGPHGVRHEHGRDWVPDETEEDKNTYMPTGIALASTWNRELGHAYGSVLGNEAKARGKHMLLGPGLNIIRSPLNGRNFEYLSEDPYLTAQMGTGYIQGVQSQGISTCVKHFVANNQETERFTIDAIVGERALREIYLPAFKAGVEADAWSFMGAYNKVNGQHATNHEYLINEVLKGEYGFQGAVISDWGAVHDTKEALLYGNDLEMGTDRPMLPNPDHDQVFTAFLYHFAGGIGGK
ncbi:MAG: glycoside hydrolase family 3 N-terminal domain-containing protein, partial [Bacteroidota bacterium]